MPALYIIAAFVADLLFGDPERMPHPVRLTGKLISFLERLLLRPADGPTARRARGAALAALVVSASYALTYALVEVASAGLGTHAAAAVSVVVAYTTLSARGLADAARAVMLPLQAGDLQGARKALSKVVGRDTAELGPSGIARGAVETVAENASDGIVAPLFYLAIGGAPLAMAYKAVNTMDSMIGYKDERYEHFGLAAARLDDAANYIPARLTALFIVAASYVLDIGKIRGFDWRGSWRIFKRDGANHSSPNSGRPEAAVAGALSVRLGGEISYRGVNSVKPFIGEPKEALSAGKIRDAIKLMYAASLVALCVLSVLAWSLHG